MRITGFAALFVLFAVVSSPAQEPQIRQLLQNILNQPTDTDLPTTKDFFTKINEVTVGALTNVELQEVLPLAQECIRSPRPNVRQDGLFFFIALVMRPDSAKLLEPYVDDLGKLTDGAEGNVPLRHAALYVLGSMRPNSPANAVAMLSANLESSRNSSEETLTIAASLLEAAPGDASNLHRVLAVTSNRSDSVLTNGVLRQLGLSKIHLPEAIAFISTNLGHADPYIRGSAVDAAARLEYNDRIQLSSQLDRIASDPTESKEVRGQARLALRQ